MAAKLATTSAREPSCVQQAPSRNYRADKLSVRGSVHKGPLCTAPGTSSCVPVARRRTPDFTLGIPTDGHFQQLPGRCPVKIRPRMVSGTKDEVNFFLHHIDFAVARTDLMVALVEAA